MSKKNAYNYFDLFNKMMEYGCQSAQLLDDIARNYDYTKLETYKADMHHIEHSADLTKHEIVEHLLKEFLPPIDRDDIVKITHLLDEICDCTEEVLIQLYIDDVHECRQDVVCITSIVVTLCQELKELMIGFESFKKNKTLREHIISVNTGEEEGDRLYHEAVRKLATDGTDLRDIVRWRDVYSCLEDCCDACENLADAVEEVLMKNS